MIRLPSSKAAAAMLAALAAATTVIAPALAQEGRPPQHAPQGGPDGPMGGPMGGPMDGRSGPWMMMRHGPMIEFAAIDTDGNGILSREELTARATARLSTADSNHDGALQRDELIAAMPGPRNGLMMVFAPDPAAQRADWLLEWMGATDAGQVAIASLADRQVNGILARLDSNDDGAISKAEADAARQSPPQRRSWWHGDDDGPARSGK